MSEPIPHIRPASHFSISSRQNVAKMSLKMSPSLRAPLHFPVRFFLTKPANAKLRVIQYPTSLQSERRDVFIIDVWHRPAGKKNAGFRCAPFLIFSRYHPTSCSSFLSVQCPSPVACIETYYVYLSFMISITSRCIRSLSRSSMTLFFFVSPSCYQK